MRVIICHKIQKYLIVQSNGVSKESDVKLLKKTRD